MMKIFVLMFLLSLGLQSESLKENIGTVQLLEEDGQTIPVITAQMNSNFSSADQIIVRTFYRSDMQIDGRTVQLLLSRVSVIPFVPDVAVAADDVPAKKDMIAFVDLTVVKSIGHQRVEMK
jgi:hypothetical protein